MHAPSVSARVGAIMSVLGVVLILCSYFFPIVIWSYSASQVPWLLMSLALILLGISAFACFRTPPPGLIGLHLGISLLGFLLQLFAYIVNRAFACFDICNPQRTASAYWILLGLGGFLLSGLGALVILGGSQPRKA